MDGYIKGNGCFRSNISPNKFIDFRIFFLEGFFIVDLSLIILNSIYFACGEFRIITDLWDVKSNQGEG